MEERFLQSKTFKGVLTGLGIAAVALLLFWAGMHVGERKALFTCNWGENYYANFAGGGHRDHGWFRPDSGRPSMSGHGAFGQIISVKDDAIVVKGRDDVERDVAVTDDTIIKREGDTVKLADLKVGDNVMAFGSPDDSGRITATLVRVMTSWPPVPPPSTNVPVNR